MVLVKLSPSPPTMLKLKSSTGELWPVLDCCLYMGEGALDVP